MGSRSQSSVFQTLNVERLTCNYLHLNEGPIRLNGYPFGTADLPNTANFITGGALQRADWLSVNPDSLGFILNKPTLAKVATTGSYGDLLNTPDMIPVNADWNQQDPTQLSFVENKPRLATVATSGLYSDIAPGSGQPVVPTTVDYSASSSTGTTLAVINKPVIPAAPVNADWAVTTASSLAYIKNKPSLSAVALSGSFGDLLNKPIVYQTADWSASANSGTTLAIANKPTIPAAQVNSDWNANAGAAAILNRPTIPASQVNSDWNVATGAAAILNKPVIPPAQVNSDWNASQGSVAYVANKPGLGKVATSNNYGDLNNLPTITPQQQSDWAASSGVTYIQNKPVLQTVATSAKYSDLLSGTGQPVLPNTVDWSLTASTVLSLAIKNKPTIPAAQVNSDWGQSDNTQISFINNKPLLATVATSGSYNDLSNKPVVSGNVQANYTQTDSTQANYVQNKPVLATVATSGRFSDLAANSGQPSSVTAADWNASSASGGVVPVLNKPSIPTAQVNSDWNSTSGVSQINNRPTLATVATSGSYSDLANKPNVTAPANADWNSTTGLSQIYNKPTLATVATSGKYTDLTAQPTVPIVADWSLTSTSGTSLAVINHPTALSAFANDLGYYKPNDSPIFAGLAASSITTTTLSATSFQAGGTATFYSAVNMSSTHGLYLASDLNGSRDPNAGTLTYNPPGGACTPASSSSGSVDFYGAGTAAGSRLLNLWDIVTVQGTLTVLGSTSLQAATATTLTASGAVSTGALTSSSISTGGNLSATGTLGVSGSSTLQAVTATTITASGAVSAGALTASSLSTGGNLTVTGTAAIAGATSTHALTATSLTTSGNLSVSGTATTGALTASSVTNTGNETVAGTLGVTGATTFAAVTATSLTTSGNLSVSGTATTGALTVTSVTNTGNESISGTLRVTGATTAPGINVPGSNIINFGSDVTKTGAAGNIGYQTYTVGALDIVGAGTGTPRNVKLWDNVTIPGTLTMGGSIYANTLDGSASTSSNVNYFCNSGLSHVWWVGSPGATSTAVILNAGNGIYPNTDNQLGLGSSGYRWKNLYTSGQTHAPGMAALAFRWCNANSISYSTSNSSSYSVEWLPGGNTTEFYGSNGSNGYQFSNATNSRWVCPVAGLWSFTFSFGVDTSAGYPKSMRLGMSMSPTAIAAGSINPQASYSSGNRLCVVFASEEFCNLPNAAIIKTSAIVFCDAGNVLQCWLASQTQTNSYSWANFGSVNYIEGFPVSLT